MEEALLWHYNHESKYDVIFLMHCSYCSSGWCLSQGYNVNDGGMYQTNGNFTKNMLDYMIYNEYIKPFVAVTPIFYDNDTYDSDEDSISINNFGHELINYLIPFIINNFSPY